MNQQELIEAVLREVKRALAERGIQIASPEGNVAAPAPARMTPQAPRPAYASGGADLTGKPVIIFKDLQGIGGGEVRVARRAVITPLAMDFAREKGIKFVRNDSSGKKEEPVMGTIAAALAVAPDSTAGGKAVRALLEAKGIAVREITGQTYENAVVRLAEAVASGAAVFGVCMERTGMEGPVHANRNRAVRAVHCRDMYEARAARVDIDANVVVIDSQSDPAGVIAGFTGME